MTMNDTEFSKKMQNRRLRRGFDVSDLKELRARIEAEEGTGPRAQQRVLARMREAEKRIRGANSAAQRAKLRKEIGLA